MSDLASDLCLLSATGVEVPDFGTRSRSEDSPTKLNNNQLLINASSWANYGSVLTKVFGKTNILPPCLWIQVKW